MNVFTFTGAEATCASARLARRMRGTTAHLRSSARGSPNFAARLRHTCLGGPVTVCSRRGTEVRAENPGERVRPGRACDKDRVATVGTPGALLDANPALHPGGAVEPSAVVDPRATLRRSVARARARVERAAVVEETFLLDGAVVGCGRGRRPHPARGRGRSAAGGARPSRRPRGGRERLGGGSP